MCQKIKIISRVKRGELTLCEGCQNYNLTFNNLFFQFTKNQLLQFREYVSKIDVDYWLEYSFYTT